MLIARISLMVIFIIMGIIIICIGINKHYKLSKKEKDKNKAEIIFLMYSILGTAFITLAGNLWVNIGKELL